MITAMDYAPPDRLRRVGRSLGVAETLYVPGFLDRDYADRVFACVLADTRWQRERFTLFGRAVTAPRLTAWYGDSGTAYRYSGTTRLAEPWTTAIGGLATKVVAALDRPFNYVLVNRYRDGNDMLGWHADDERDLGHSPVIAAVSLGAERTFRIRSRQGGTSIGRVLEHGSLLVMWGASQRHYKHCLPRTRKAVGERLSFTFRFTGLHES